MSNGRFQAIPLFSVGLIVISLFLIQQIRERTAESRDCPQVIHPTTVKIEIVSQGGHALNKIDYEIDLLAGKMILRRYSPKEEMKESIVNDRKKIDGVLNFFASNCFEKKKGVGQPLGGYSQVKIVDGDGSAVYLAPFGGVPTSKEYYEMTNEQMKRLFRMLPPF